MSSAPLAADVLIERIQASVTALQNVRASADYARISGEGLRSFRTPEAFVVLVRENGKPSPGNTRQVAIAKFAVITAVRNYGYKAGAPAMDDAAPIIGQIRDSLIGWIPPVRGGEGCTWIEGRVLDYDAGTLLWSDIFQTQHFIGSIPT